MFSMGEVINPEGSEDALVACAALAASRKPHGCSRPGLPCAGMPLCTQVAHGLWRLSGAGRTSWRPLQLATCSLLAVLRLMRSGRAPHACAPAAASCCPSQPLRQGRLYPTIACSLQVRRLARHCNAHPLSVLLRELAGARFGFACWPALLEEGLPRESAKLWARGWEHALRLLSRATRGAPHRRARRGTRAQTGNSHVVSSTGAAPWRMAAGSA